MALYCLNLREPLGPKDGERINHESFGPFRILAGFLGTFCCYGEGCLFQVKYCMSMALSFLICLESYVAPPRNLSMIKTLPALPSDMLKVTECIYYKAKPYPCWRGLVASPGLVSCWKACSLLKVQVGFFFFFFGWVPADDSLLRSQAPALGLEDLSSDIRVIVTSSARWPGGMISLPVPVPSRTLMLLLFTWCV